jgi:hypothetical protein
MKKNKQNRGYIILDDVSNRYCKTEEYLAKYKGTKE